MEILLSTQEAARLAGVGTTSIKRWADSGLIECRKTVGGHRRFEKGTLDRFLQGHGQSPEKPTSDWTDVLLGGDGYALRAALYDARSRLGAWHAVADELGPALREFGDRWKCGEVTVLDEHVASERLARALAHVADGSPVSERGPRCLLASAQGDEHTLGLSLAELCLREVGWSTLWAGRRTPIQELIGAIDRGECALVALSSSGCGNAKLVAKQATQIADACRRQGISLALGGSGAWPDTLNGAKRFETFAPFHVFAKERLREAERLRR